VLIFAFNKFNSAEGKKDMIFLKKKTKPKPKGTPEILGFLLRLPLMPTHLNF
jgi:hypothetical protein